MRTGPPPRKRRTRARRCCAKRGKESSGLCRTNTVPLDRKQAISLELRPYQQEAVDAAIKGFDEFKRQLLVCPTGSGKTVIFAKLAEHYQPARTLVVAHREELLQQARDKILTATGLVAQIEAADRRVSLDAPVVVASVQTLSRAARRERFPSGHLGWWSWTKRITSWPPATRKSWRTSAAPRCLESQQRRTVATSGRSQVTSRTSLTKLVCPS